ncbi:hypothetical protein P9112_009403 [Eukaryota sp. TZLM1-RC]
MELPKDELGYSYILVCVDAFTRFAFLTPLKNKSSEVVADALYNSVFSIFGLPLRLHSDNGAEFCNQIMDILTKRLGIEQTHSYPHWHQSNGLVERKNRDILDTLQKFLAENPSLRWSDMIARIQLILNNSVCSRTSFTPHQLIFGSLTKPRRNTLDVLLHKSSCTEVNKLDKRMKAAKYLEKLDSDLRANVISANEIQKRFIRNLQDDHPRFKTNDLVIRLYDKPHKLRVHSGPFQVKEVIGNSGYVIRSFIGPEEYKVSGHELSLFTPNILDGHARQVAANDRNEAVVQAVTGHEE